MEKLKKAKKEWLHKKEKNSQDADRKFVTASSAPVEILATPADLDNFDYLRDLNHPGEFPYTRGIHYNMYRGKMWTMRQFAGFGTPRDTNKRFKYLLNHGQTG
ncbi:MAG: methylmalonyl-CoA mutase, partial [Calditrichaeota bacterium]